MKDKFGINGAFALSGLRKSAAYCRWASPKAVDFGLSGLHFCKWSLRNDFDFRVRIKISVQALRFTNFRVQDITQ